MLSKKTQYAFRALTYLAKEKTNSPVLIATIAADTQIPIKFLESILLTLKNKGILGSKKGKGGGYFFEKPANQVSLASVMRLVDGPIALLPCVSLYFYKRCTDCDETTCGLRKVMTEVRDASLQILQQKTVADLVLHPELQ